MYLSPHNKCVKFVPALGASTGRPCQAAAYASVRALMIFLRRLLKIEAVVLTALVALACALATVSAILAAVADNAILGVGGSALIVFGYTCLIGGIPAIFFGAPMYAALLHFGKASWLSVLALGVTPGVLLLVIAIELGVWAIGCGAFIALATHFFCRPGSNSSVRDFPSTPGE